MKDHGRVIYYKDQCESVTLATSTLIHTVIAYLFRTDVYSSLFLKYIFLPSEIPPSHKLSDQPSLF